MDSADQSSLSVVLNKVIDAEIAGAALENQSEIFEFLLSRIDQKNSYCRMPAPTDQEMVSWPLLYTGEKISSRVSASHILGEEASRAVIRLSDGSKEAKEAIESIAGIPNRLGPDEGWFCCRTCTISLWRHLSARGDNRRLEAGVARLRSGRKGDGRWDNSVFYYTVLALHTMEIPAAKEELTYAASILEKTAKRNADSEVAQRRKLLAQKVLETL